MRQQFLPFAKPSISEEAIEDVNDSLRSGWITSGPKLKKFETLLSEYTNASNAVCLNSATAGLHLALLALNLKETDEVITTPMTFAATLNVIELVGAKVKLVDVNLSDYNIDISKIEQAINENTKVIMPVHFAGLPVDLKEIYNLAKKHNLVVIEDSAHAIGAEYDGKKIGSFGDFQVFSFHPNKNMTTGEGGCITSPREDFKKYFDEINLLKFHGMDREAWNRFGKTGSPHYQIVCPGFKYNLMDIQAALGIHQIKALDAFIEKRTYLAQRYYQLLNDVEELILPQMPNYKFKHAWHLFAPRVNSEKTRITRDELMNELKNNNIGCGLHYEAAHLYPYYKTKYGYDLGDFPNAELIGGSVISLPLFPGMSESDQDDVVSTLKDIFNCFRK